MDTSSPHLRSLSSATPAELAIAASLALLDLRSQAVPRPLRAIWRDLFAPSPARLADALLDTAPFDVLAAARASGRRIQAAIALHYPFIISADEIERLVPVINYVRTLPIGTMTLCRLDRFERRDVHLALGAAIQIVAFADRRTIQPQTLKPYLGSE